MTETLSHVGGPVSIILGFEHSCLFRISDFDICAYLSVGRGQALMKARDFSIKISPVISPKQVRVM